MNAQTPVKGRTLTVDGDFSQTRSGRLEIRISGPASEDGYDRIRVSRIANISGSLHVSLIGGYLPPLGETYRVLDAGTVKGSFRRVSGLAVGSDRALDPILDDDGMTLET